jgi:sensor histidine kinase YesM
LKLLFTKKRFLVIQLIFWSVYSMITLYAFGNGVNTFEIAIIGFFIFFIPGFTITTMYHLYLLKYEIDFAIIKKIIPYLILALFLHFLVTIFLQIFYNRLLQKEDIYQGVSFFNFAISVFIIVSIINLPWYLVYHINKYVTALHQKEIEAITYREENGKLQIVNLTNKLNPHFLFNTLNTIRWLTNEENTEARSAINNLSDILRYTLIQNPDKLVSIKAELDIVEKYLIFEKIRFEERLHYWIKCPEELYPFKIIAFSLLNLVENAIKHGISNIAEGGFVAVLIEDEIDKVVITITNTGILNDANNNGFGVASLQKLLHYTYKEGASVQIKNNNENEVLANIIIPKK